MEKLLFGSARACKQEYGVVPRQQELYAIAQPWEGKQLQEDKALEYLVVFFIGLDRKWQIAS